MRTTLWTVVLGVYIPCIAALFIVWRVAGRQGISFGELSRDPISTFRAPTHIGILSNMGILAWAVAATTSLVTARALWQARTPIARWLGCAGALSAWLLLDDLFMLHERIFPLLSLPQQLIFGAYVVWAVWMVVTFRRTILEHTDAPLLACALGWFTLSLGIDLFAPSKSPVIEDSPKLLGVLTWAIYFVQTSLRHLRAALRTSPA